MRLVRLAGWFLTATLIVAPAAVSAQTAETPQAGTPGTTAEWDQEKVAALADELAQAVHEVRRSAKAVPGPGVQTGQAAAWMQFEDNLKLLENETKVMARQLRDGKTHDETLQRYQRMWMLIRDIRENGRRMAIPQDLQEKIDAARAVLDQFDAYYA